ncbi:MAG: hypothetical protein APU95_03190 [Hadesarchaea archaeon YNP_N21]|nr:MAG: hypothetical protein APU95_03190 [Hadesarchaea archaeon YNP_N21]
MAYLSRGGRNEFLVFLSESDERFKICHARVNRGEVLRKIFAYPEKCTGCGICELACSMVKENTCSPARALIKVQTWLKEGFSIPLPCRQCEIAFCEQACPVGAITRDPKTGAWVVNPETCIGCGECVEACPFGSIYLSAERGLAVKCDLCGGNPKCVELCPTKAILYQDSTEVSFEKNVANAERLFKISGGNP